MKMAERGQPVLLWGMMGAGKSAVARELQSRTSLRVVDLDEFIQTEQSQSPSDIITAHGLAVFREIEAAAIRKLLTVGRVDVLSLGGGSLLDPTLRTEVRRSATVCSLHADVAILHARVQGDGVNRPLLGTSAEEQKIRLAQLVDERRDAYLDVDFVIDTSELAIDEVVTSLLRIVEIREAA